MSFLESFTHNKFHADRNGINPDVITSTNRHFSDDVFKIWAASKVIQGVSWSLDSMENEPFHKFNGAVQFEREIADLYVTLGGNRSSIIFGDVGQFLGRLAYGKWNPAGIALIVTVTFPRYTFDLRSFALAGEMLGYLEDLFSFYSNLDYCVQRNSLSV